MDKIIAFANQKGGVGKTTSCINLAATLGARGQKVLLVDLDSQGHATMGSGIDKNQLEHSVYDVLVEGANIESVILKGLRAGYDLLPANGDLTAAEVRMFPLSSRETLLNKVLMPITTRYDVIFLDCPPSLSLLTVNALTAAQGVIVPMQCEYFALDGLSALMATIQKIRDTLNPSLHILGILRTMYDPRNRLASDVGEELLQHFPNQVYTAIVPRNVRLAEAPSFGLPVLLYDPISKGAKAYAELADEFVGQRRAP